MQKRQSPDLLNVICAGSALRGDFKVMIIDLASLPRLAFLLAQAGANGLDCETLPCNDQ
jgi:hypothetical protein